MRARVDAWLFDTHWVSAESLAVTRILTALVCLIVVFPQWLWIESAPPGAYMPPLGLAIFFGEPPSASVFAALNLIGVMAALLLFVGAWTRSVSVVLSVTLILGNTFHYAFGKIDHTILMVLLPMFGAAAGWGEAFSWDEVRSRRPPRVRAWPVAIFALIVAVPMTESGLIKATTGWLDPNRAAVHSNLIGNSISVDRGTPFSDAVLLIRSPLFWEAADWSAVILECGFLMAVWRRRHWSVVLSAACLFHLANALLFRIPFYTNPVAYALFVRWPPPFALRVIAAKLKQLPFYGVMIVALLTAAYYVRYGNPFATLANALWRDPEWLRPTVVVVAAAAVALVWLIGHSGWWWPRIQVDELAKQTFRAGGSAVILYDGYCGLCDKWVDLVVRHDRTGFWRFCPLQSTAGMAMLQAAGLRSDDTDSIVVVLDGRLYRYSTAILVALTRIGGPWRAAGVLAIVPVVIRDIAYLMVARNRYRFFGRRSTCRLPTAEERTRFLS